MIEESAQAGPRRPTAGPRAAVRRWRPTAAGRPGPYVTRPFRVRRTRVESRSHDSAYHDNFQLELTPAAAARTAGPGAGRAAKLWHVTRTVTVTLAAWAALTEFRQVHRSL